MGHGKKIWIAIVLFVFLFVGISFARNMMSTLSTSYSWPGVAFWFGVISFVWLIILGILTHRKNRDVHFYQISMDKIEISPRIAGEALYFRFWVSLLAFSIVLILIGAALFDKFVAYDFLKWVVDLLKWIIEKGWSGIQKLTPSL